jgi:hypothetical protein
LLIGSDDILVALKHCAYWTLTAFWTWARGNASFSPSLVWLCFQ